MTASSLPYPPDRGGRRFVGAALVVLMHIAALWAFMAASPPFDLPEDQDLQTLLIQDIAIDPPSPSIPPQALEKVVETPPPPPPAPVRESAPEKPAPAAVLEPAPAPARPLAVAPPPLPVSAAAPAPPPTPLPALAQVPMPVPVPAKSQVPVVASESRSAAPADAIPSTQFPAAAVPLRLYPPSVAHQGPVVAEAPRAAVAVSAPAPAPAPVPPPTAVALSAPASAAPSAPPPPVAAAVAGTGTAAQRSAIDAVCPPELQAKPGMPLKARDEPGDEWLVSARITIHNDVVTDVKILSGPKVFHDSVRKAIRQYRCKADGGEAVVTQVLRFKLQ